MQHDTETPTEPRHVLVIEANRAAYIAPHQRPHTERCEAVSRAFRVFAGVPADGEPVADASTFAGIAAGRYWFDVLEDGNAWIGGRVDA